MVLYSKRGSIPHPVKDNTPGWMEVTPPPVAPEGMETVWWYPPGWVVRPIKPESVNGEKWSWSQSEFCWVSSAGQKQPEPVAVQEPVEVLNFPSATSI